MFLFLFASRYLRRFALLDEYIGFTTRKHRIEISRKMVRTAKTVRPSQKSRK